MSLSNRLNLKHVSFKGKRVLVRVDYNVPLDKMTGKVADPKRIVATIPTLKYILAQKPRCVVLMSHMGRPNGKRNMRLTLATVLPELEKHLGQAVIFLSDCAGPHIEAVCKNPPTGSVILLENLRFHAEETGSVKVDGVKLKADKADVAKFRKSLSQLGDVYVNDAFGTAHRKHSSMVGVNLPVRAAGFLLQKELDAFSQVLEKPKKPLLAVLGGAKVKDKIQLIDSLLDSVDEMIITGGMAFTFKKVVHNVDIGSSLFDQKGAKIAQRLVDKAKKLGVKLHFPIDYIVGNKLAGDALVNTADDVTGIQKGWLGLDVGPRSIALFKQVIERARSIVFNGPMGVFEFKPFSRGTKETLEAVARVTREKGALTIIGGGDTAAAASIFGVAADVSHVSTGGGASLELLEGKNLPGIAFLSKVGDASNTIGSAL